MRCCSPGDLQAVKKQVFELKEGVDYKIKISFKVNPGTMAAVGGTF